MFLNILTVPLCSRMSEHDTLLDTLSARWAFIVVGTSANTRLLVERAHSARFYTRQVNIRDFSRMFDLA